MHFEVIYFTPPFQILWSMIYLVYIVNLLLAAVPDGVRSSVQGDTWAGYDKGRCLDDFARGHWGLFMAWHWTEGNTPGQTWAEPGRATHSSLAPRLQDEHSWLGALSKHCTQLASFLRTAPSSNLCRETSCFCSRVSSQTSRGLVHLCSAELEIINQNVFGCCSSTESVHRGWFQSSSAGSAQCYSVFRFVRVKGVLLWSLTFTFFHLDTYKKYRRADDPVLSCRNGKRHTL